MVSPTLPFPVSLPSPFQFPLSFQTNQWEGRSDPVRGKFPGFPPTNTTLLMMIQEQQRHRISGIDKMMTRWPTRSAIFHPNVDQRSPKLLRQNNCPLRFTPACTYTFCWSRDHLLSAHYTIYLCCHLCVFQLLISDTFPVSSAVCVIAIYPRERIHLNRGDYGVNLAYTVAHRILNFEFG